MTDWTRETPPTTAWHGDTPPITAWSAELPTASDWTGEEGVVTAHELELQAVTTAYLRRTSGLSWADVLAGIPNGLVRHIDLGDYNYLYMGKAYWTAVKPPTQNWGMGQSFLIFDCSALPAEATLTSAVLRLHISSGANSEPTSATNLIVTLLGGDYRPLEKGDWQTTGGTAQTVSTSGITGTTGDRYIEIALNAAQRALVEARTSIYVNVRHEDQTTAPTNIKRIVAYAVGYATVAKRPLLTLSYTVPKTSFYAESGATTTWYGEA